MTESHSLIIELTKLVSRLIKDDTAGVRRTVSEHDDQLVELADDVDSLRDELARLRALVEREPKPQPEPPRPRLLIPEPRDRTLGQYDPLDITFKTSADLLPDQDILVQLFREDWGEPLQSKTGASVPPWWRREMEPGVYWLQAWLRPDDQKIDVRITIRDEDAEPPVITDPTPDRPDEFIDAPTISPGTLSGLITDRIWLEPGEYTLQKTLHMRDRAAIGAKPGTVRIRCPDDSDAIHPDFDTIIYGLHIDGGQHAVNARDAADVTVDSCVCTIQKNHAVFAANCPRFGLIDSVIHDWGYQSGDINPWDGEPCSGTRYGVYLLGCDNAIIERCLFGWPVRSREYFNPIQHRTENNAWPLISAEAVGNVMLYDMIQEWNWAIRFQSDNNESNDTFSRVTATGNRLLGAMVDNCRIVNVKHAASSSTTGNIYEPTSLSERRDILRRCIEAGHSGPARGVRKDD